MLSSLWVDAIQRIAISLELCLDAAAFLLLPILVLAPHGIAPLATIAGGVALGLVLRNGKAEFRPLQLPAALLGALLVWGTVSAGWSVDPAHSLLIAARLGGLFAAGLVLTAAAGALVLSAPAVALLLHRPRPRPGSGVDPIRDKWVIDPSLCGASSLLRS